MSIRRTAIGAMTAALLVSALPAATLAQDEIVDEFDVSPEGVVWTLTATGETPVPAGVEASLFMEGGEANGSTGCNSFSGTYTLDGDSLAFDEDFAVTQAFCEGAPGEVEQAYLAALPTVASWSMEGNELSLADEAGSVVLTYVEPIVDITETDIDALIAELERLHLRINNTRQDVRQLNVDRLRERVVANEAVLEDLTERFINVRARASRMEKRLATIEEALGLVAASAE